MITTTCPVCEGSINLRNEVIQGQPVRCPHCFEDYVVVATDPLELGWPFDDEGWLADSEIVEDLANPE